MKVKRRTKEKSNDVTLTLYIDVYVVHCVQCLVFHARPLYWLSLTQLDTVIRDGGGGGGVI